MEGALNTRKTAGDSGCLMQRSFNLEAFRGQNIIGITLKNRIG